MSNLLYVGAAVVLSAVGSFVLWARAHKPRSLESGIDEFNRELNALSPERRQEPPRG